MSNVKGLDKLLSNLDKMPDEVREIVHDQTFINAQQIETNAKRLAPRDTSFMRNMIRVANTTKDKNRIEYSVVSPVKYSAYVEFGTGGRASVPAELQSQARKIQAQAKKGNFEEGLDNIKEWCRSHGIEESAAWPIFMSILKKGLKPRPFLYPSLIRQIRPYLADLEHSLQPYLDKL